MSKTLNYYDNIFNYIFIIIFIYLVIHYTTEVRSIIFYFHRIFIFSMFLGKYKKVQIRGLPW